ncbi:DUF937 domain-containing protein [Deinococcus lacus]|uniref:DUF937 domain-containing protein n=1 Tax=Deinococcus lacus TaxID=392561 RepID=A0ABW1YCY0_9DEIO
MPAREASRAVQGALPVILHALSQQGGTATGAGELLKLSEGFARVATPEGQLQPALLESPAELGGMEVRGISVLNQLFDNPAEVSGRLGTALGFSGEQAGRLVALLTPIVLGLLGQRARATRTDAAGLSSVLQGLSGQLVGLIPEGMGTIKSILNLPLYTGKKVVAAAPVAAPAAPVAASTPPVREREQERVLTAAPPAERSGCNPLWLIPLLLLALGGWWLMNNQKTETAPAQTQTQTETQTETAPVPAGSIVVEQPAADAVTTTPFTLSGTGPANSEILITEGTTEVARAASDASGRWSTEVSPADGAHTYTLTSGEATTDYSFTVGAADTAAAGTETAPATSVFAITEPVAGAELPAGGFTLSGTGPAGESVQLFEDGTSLGNIVVPEGGQWTFTVPSPAEGAHTYVLKDAEGAELATVATTTQAAAEGAAASCDQDYTLSMADGQTVNEPFRFGGVGRGEGYSVTVKRGDRVIGTKEIPLDASCGWSYQSTPGAGPISYEVRPMEDASAAPLSTVTLTVQ